MNKKALKLFIALTGVALMTSCISGQPGSSTSKQQTKAPKEDTSVQTPRASEAASGQEAQPVQNSSVVYPFSDHPTVNVYLETSGSMNGYVNGGTSIFQQVVKEYLSGINNAGFAGQVNYNYITSKITPKGNNLDDYITKLTPSNFSANGNAGTTDIGAIFKTILGSMDSNTISIFISDCIISPGKGKDTEAYLRGQMIDVRDAVVSYTSKYEDLACLVYQFNSGFNGSYYDYENTKHANVSMQRPFYIWVFGHTCNVALMKLKYVPDKDFRVAPIRNSWMIFNTKLSILSDGIKYGLMLPNTPANGKYDWVNATTLKALQKPSPSDNYRFTFGADMSVATHLMGDDYVMDTDNYVHIVNKLSKQEFFGTINPIYAQNNPYSHSFSVESETPVPRGEFKLAFIPNVPKWSVECTDLDDRSFNGSNNDKTYGLMYIFHGLYNGYNNGGVDNILTEFNFEIK